jgi:beta-glucosidase
MTIRRSSRRRGRFALGAGAFAVVAAAVALIGGGATPARGAGPSCPWMNTRLAAAQRAQMLLNAMTIDQKVQMVAGGGKSVGKSVGAISAIPSLCIPALGLSDGAAGLGNGNTGVTAFPAPLARAASFDTATEQQFGVALGQEFWSKGDNIWLAPNVNIGRYPLNGRNFEAYGEDPFLSGQMAVKAIVGAQSQHVIATVKHYILNESETNRNYESSNVDDRTFHEIYLAPFEAAVKQGHVGSVMCSYNRVDEIYSCANKTTETDVLKNLLGFDGFVMSDWFFAAHTVTDANAGLDMEMPNPVAFATIKEAVETGVVPQSRLDNMVYRTLFSMFRIGLFDHPVPTPAADVSTDAHKALALKIAEDGSVLLKNVNGQLPLQRHGLKIAVIGDVGPGGTANVCTGGGSAVVDCTPVDPLTAIQQRAAQNGDTVTFDNGSDTATAAATAAAADVAVVFGYYTEAEGSNRATLGLDGNGDTLIADVAAANPHTVAVLMTGGPTTMPWLSQVSAVLEAWYPGVEMGNAIAALLFGDANPSGRLPETFPRSTADLPTAGSATQQNDESPELDYTEGLKVGYRWYDSQRIAPLFPFGFGLSYTTFTYSGLQLQNTDNGVNVVFTVTNTGNRKGTDVPQVYVTDPASAGEPSQQLKGFARVTLTPGSSTTVSIPLDARSFSFWSTTSQSWVAAPGCYSIGVGNQSRHVTLRAPAGIFTACNGNELTGIENAIR